MASTNRVAQPGFAPPPALVDRIAVEHDAGRLQGRNPGVQIVTLEIQARATRPRRIRAVDREGRAAGTQETGVGIAGDDQFEPQTLIEGARPGDVGDLHGDLVEVHVSCPAFAARSAAQRSSRALTFSS